MLPRAFDPLDLSSREFWSRPARERGTAFTELRAQRPVSWHAPVEGGYGAMDAGGFDLGVASAPFWAIVRHADIAAVSRDTKTFSSASGVMIEEMPKDYLEVSSSFLVMDPPRHSRFRKIVSGAFTPRAIAALEEQIGRKVSEVVDQTVAVGKCEIVEALSNRIPLWTISQLMGVPEDRRSELMHNANMVVGADDPELVPAGSDVTELVMNASLELHALAHELVALRRETPADDVISRLAHAEVDGQRLTDAEIGSVFILFAVAGNDTSRNSISHGIKAFADNPEQWDRFRADPEANLARTVEEIFRWATPVIQFRRTVVRDVEIGGQHIAAGENVVLFYESANRDESMFPDPWRFDITREPKHVSFGGGGPHFCMGAALARRQVGAVFSRLARHVERFEVSEPELFGSHFVHGITRMDCRFHLTTKG